MLSQNEGIGGRKHSIEMAVVLRWIAPLLLAAIGLYLTYNATSSGSSRLLGAKIGLPLAYAVFILLICFSWFITESRVRSTNYWWLVLCGYLAVVGFCWFFSFSSYLMTSTVNSGAVYADFERTLISFGRIPIELEKQSRVKVQNEEENLRKSQIIENYANGIIAIEERLRGETQNKDFLQEIAKVQKEDLDEVRAQYKDLSTMVENQKNEAADVDRSLQSKKDEQKKATKNLLDLEKEKSEVVDALEKESDRNNKNLDETSSSSKLLPGVAACNIKREGGVGFCSIALQDLKTQLEKKCKKAEEKSHRLTTEISNLELKAKVWETDLKTSKKNIEAKDLKVNALVAATQNLGPVENLPDRVRTFKASPSHKEYEAVRNLCEIYLKVLKPGDITTCMDPQVILLFENLDQKRKQLRDLEATCEEARGNLEKDARMLAAEARKHTDGITPQIHNAAYDQIQNKVIDPCLEKAGNLSLDTDTILERISQFRREQDPDVDNLERAGRQFFNVLTGRSKEVFHYFAFFISLMQELILLGSKLFFELLRLRSAPPEETDITFTSEDAAVAGLLFDCCVEKNRRLVLIQSKFDDLIERVQKPLVNDLLYKLELVGCISLTGVVNKRKVINSRGRKRLYDLRRQFLTGKEPLEPARMGETQSSFKPKTPEDNSEPDNNSGVAEDIISPSPKRPYPQDPQRKPAGKPVSDSGKGPNTGVSEQTSSKSESEQPPLGSNKRIYPRVLYDRTLESSNSDASEDK